MRFWSKLLPLLLLTGHAHAEDGSPVGRTIDNFTLTEPSTGKKHSLADYRDRKAVVVVFLGTHCPINNLYLPRLNRFQEEYAEQGVQLIGINANVNDTAKDIAAHVKEHAIAFPVLRDPGANVADQFGAKMTPEAFVLDGKKTIRYHGRIDNQYGYLYRKLDATEETLKDAIESVVAGRKVNVPTTEVAGCYITRRPEAPSKGSVTFTRDIFPLLQKHCQECHREGQIGPMSLMDYQDVADWSASIKLAVEGGRMPPWHADPSIGVFSNDRHMPDPARRVLLKWIAEGCPKGDPADMPESRTFLGEGEWRIGKPDLLLEMPQAYDVPADTPRGGIPYKYFFIDTGFEEDRWVQRAEAKPGAPTVVHHIIAFIVPPSDGIDPEYPEFPFLPGARNVRVLCGTAPGDLPTIIPEGHAIRIPARSKIVFQMHYTPNGKAERDLSKVGIIFAKEKPEREVMTMPVYNERINIPPGESNYEMRSRYTFKHDAKILGVMPHMHLRGKDFKYVLRTPDGSEEPLLWVPRYDFNWQTAYRFKEPVVAPKGSQIICTAHYDNSSNNPSNPDPNQRVRWGDQTWQEMMIGWTDFVYDRPPK